MDVPSEPGSISTVDAIDGEDASSPIWTRTSSLEYFEMTNAEEYALRIVGLCCGWVLEAILVLVAEL